MNLTRGSLAQPALLAALVSIICLFGGLSLWSLPIQLLPQTTRPVISVNNGWPQAAPADLESYIIEPQEAMLRRVPGVREITSNINQGFGSISLEFELGADMDQALLNVISALNQAPPRPLDANEPFVFSGASGNNGQLVASIQIRPLPDNPDQDIYSPRYQAVIADQIEPRLARIPGIAAVQLNSQRQQQVLIEFDPYRAAALGIPIQSIASAVNQSANSSAGSANVGRRQYTVRVMGQYDVAQLGQLIVAWNAGRPVQLDEIAKVSLAPTDAFGINVRNGFPAYYITLQRSNDGNSVAILDETRIALAELNAGPLATIGLAADLSFDSSVYVRRALNLVQGNLVLGMLLALGILWFFMPDRRSILIIALIVPISLLGSLLVVQLFGMTLNVISLAGLAFAVGLVMDAGIIVQENILRYREQGESSEIAVERGAEQVKGALFAATMTTVAVFLPVLFLDGVEGQLFRDLALTLSVAVLASMLAALTVIPVLSRRWLKYAVPHDPHAHWWDKLARLTVASTDRPSWRWGWLLATIVLPVGIAIAIKPSADFLPSARADAVNVFFNLPAGISQQTFEHELGAEIIARLKPHMDHEREPYIRGYNLSMSSAFNILYLYPEKPEETEAWIELLRGPLLQGIPDVQAFTVRASLLGIGLETGRSISVDLRGSDVALLMASAAHGAELVSERLPGAIVRPVPGASLAEPQIEILPRERRLVEAGLNPQDLARAVRAMTGGLFTGEYFDGNDRYDVILRGANWNDPGQLAAMPIWTPLAGPQTVGELAEIRRGVGPTQLRRVNGQRTISLVVVPPDHMTVEDALTILRDELGPQIQALAPGGFSIAYRGSADQIEGAMSAMLKNFLLALLVLVIVIAAIFRSLRDALLVMLVMPLALSGGLIGLQLLNLVTYQSLDMLTMVGFIILLGLVVNNAILLVSETRHGQANGLALREAVEAAVRVRARPVYMSTLTSLFGMLPLMLMPGTGSDIYRGLATVIVGGMLFSSAFTLFLMPAMLRLVEGIHLPQLPGLRRQRNVLLEEGS